MDSAWISRDIGNVCIILILSLSLVNNLSAEARLEEICFSGDADKLCNCMEPPPLIPEKPDFEPPTIYNCPPNTVWYTDKGSSVSITLTPPTATDNSGVVTLTSDHISGGMFPIGTTTVTYTATDPSGNVATCSFSVIVKDGQLGFIVVIVVVVVIVVLCIVVIVLVVYKMKNKRRKRSITPTNCDDTTSGIQLVSQNDDQPQAVENGPDPSKGSEHGKDNDYPKDVENLQPDKEDNKTCNANGQGETKLM